VGRPPNPNAKVPTVVNAGFVIGDDGVAVVDTLFTFDAKGNPGNESNKDLLTEIRKLTKLPIRYVINTHHHPDHTGGNGIFAAAGAVVVAQHNVRGWIQSENLKLLGNNITAETKAFIEALVPPTVGYDHALDLYLGARKIQVRSFPGHTGGDSVVLIPDSRMRRQFVSNQTSSLCVCIPYPFDLSGCQVWSSN